MTVRRSSGRKAKRGFAVAPVCEAVCRGVAESTPVSTLLVMSYLFAVVFLPGVVVLQVAFARLILLQGGFRHQFSTTGCLFFLFPFFPSNRFSFRFIFSPCFLLFSLGFPLFFFSFVFCSGSFLSFFFASSPSAFICSFFVSPRFFPCYSCHIRRFGRPVIIGLTGQCSCQSLRFVAFPLQCSIKWS